MASIEIILRDENGNIIDGEKKRIYELNIASDSFHDIEGGVEDFKKKALPDIEADLLKEEQRKFVIKKKMS